MSARVQFLVSGLSLIHIPLPLYPHFVQPILRLLFLSEGDDGQTGNDGHHREPWASLHRFLNISVTPVECSLVCSRQHAQELFVPLVEALGDVQAQISISREDYLVIQVDGEGLDASRRVVELTSPLALAGISIFFITTYFSDYILVPARSRGEVTRALEQRGFVFEKHADAFVNHPYHHRHASSSASSSVDGPPRTPPPSNLDELQVRTFSLLKRHNIVPTVDPNIRLIQCAGSKDTLNNGRSTHGVQLQLGLVKCFVQQPRFLSLTLTDTEPASLLIEKRLLSNFRSDDVVLLGSRNDVLIPITLDLNRLPLESTGIVCGVAGRLVGATTTTTTTETPPRSSPLNTTTAAGGGGDVGGRKEDTFPALIDMSYLSTARAGTVMVGEGELESAMEAFEGR